MLNLSSLNPQQRQAVETTDGPVLILAGAGTGKTRVITFRIAHLIDRGVSPEHILGVTFTNKAAREMKERVSKLRGRLSGTDKQVTVCTFHSLCARILRHHIARLGYKPNFVIYDEADQIGAIKKILAQISAKGEKTDPAAILQLLSRYKNGGERAAVFADESVRAMAEHIRSKYETALKACNAVDFDDLILLTLRLFAEHPDALESCRARFRYVMVDEYQDTNAAQFKLVYALTQGRRNLCVVGDDDQSIYGWRGAEIANLLDMEKFFPEVKVIKLEQNYRSTNTILNAANALIRHNVRRRGKRLWSQKGDGPKIILHTFSNDDVEAREIVEEIDYSRVVQRVPWGRHAILFRTNAQSRPLETALRQAGVRYNLIGGQSFFDRREVRDFLAYLKTLLNPRDDVNLLRIANVPPRGLSDATMERLLAASHGRRCSVFEAMQNPVVTGSFPGRARDCVEQFVTLVDRTRARLGGPDVAGERQFPAPASALGLKPWVERFLDEIGYFADLRRGEKDPESGESRIRSVQELIRLLDESASGVTTPWDSVQSFLESITLDADREEEDQGPQDAVTLITMHSCKGLEFPRVYVVGMEDGLLPHSRSKDEGTLDEERRLFYVAVTRAMEHLTISHCAARKKFGQPQPCHPSPFLKELPAELVEHADEQAKRPVTAAAGKQRFDALRNSLG
jgi:superfamily I DNA/RNA helicase